MREPIFVRPISNDERQALEEGLRSSDAFVMRRCQILLASARRRRRARPPNRPRSGLQRPETVRNAIRAFDAGGLAKALGKGSSRPRTIHAAFDAERAERLREMLHRSPREFGKPTSLWTLNLAAEMSFEEGLTEGRVTAEETVRATLGRLGVRWPRAKKRWITSPDPEYARKKRRRDRLIGLAKCGSGWVVGFEDEENTDFGGSVRADFGSFTPRLREGVVAGRKR